MDQENNYRRRKSEDGYSNANRSESGYPRYGNYRERNNDGNSYNNYRSNNTGSYGGNNRNYNRSEYDGNSYERRPYSGADRSDRNYGSGDGYGYGYNQRPNRPRYDGNDNREYNREYNPRPRPVNRPRYDDNQRYGDNQSSDRYPDERRKRPRIGEHNSSGNNYGRPASFEGNRQQYPNRDNRRPYDPNAKYSQKKQLEYKEVFTDPNVPLRLNKYLANAGICSRREADEYIQAGVVKVNGEIVTELGKKVFRTDHIVFHDKSVNMEKKAYVLLNKPKNCVTTSDDPQERLTVMDLVKDACRERIYPVGRLDRNTTGVLLLTNDGELASKLTHPKFLKKKIYHVVLDKPVTKADMQQIIDGIELDDGKVCANAINYTKEDDKKEIGIEIHIGKNRIVRRIFDKLDYKVVRLDRVYFAGLTKKSLPRGKWRYLSQREVDMLHMGAFE